MRWSSNNISTKIANFIKVPHSDILNKGIDFEPVRAILSGHQIAYKLTSGNETVIFYKKSNLNVFGKIEDTPWSPKLYKTVHILYSRPLTR